MTIRLVIFFIGIVISASLAFCKVSGFIDTDWFLWVSIPAIIGTILALFPSQMAEMIFEAISFWN